MISISKAFLKRNTLAVAIVTAIASGQFSPALASMELLKKNDSSLYQKAFDAGEKKRWDRAFLQAKKANDKRLKDVLDWSYFQDKKTKASFAEITAFISAHPGWPHMITLNKQAEQAITASTPVAQLLNWFSDHAPYTTRGLVHYAKALEDNGQTERAKQLVVDAWRSQNMARDDERALFQRYGKWLSEEDHSIRMEHLLWTGATYAAKRQARRVSKSHAYLARARIALRRRAGGVDAAIRRVPDTLKDHPGLVYERLRWRMRKGRIEDSISLLNKPEQEKEYASLWWKERGRAARWALKEGRISEAYDLAADHAAEEGYAYADAEWLSGWIALRYLQDGQSALTHFENMESRVKFPVSLSRAAYWAGRAHEFMNNKEQATEAYKRAAKFSHRFYGQLALAKLDDNHDVKPFKTVIDASSLSDPLKATKEIFGELAEVTALLDQIEENKIARSFVAAMVRQAETPEDYMYIANFSRQIGRDDLAVYTARKADQKHVVLEEDGYPIYNITKKDYLESSLIQSIIRQESGFDIAAKSHAGALGLMQLMPATAKREAKLVRVKYNKSKLTQDPDYNIHLGQSYLSGLINRFNGNLPMAFAGYNAGPSRVRRWVAQNGDPSLSLEEMIDWIELIPFTETRNYVQRVSEHYIIYSQKLGIKDRKLSLESLTLNKKAALGN